MKMLSLPASPASIQRLHARLVPGGTPPLEMSPIYLLMTIKSMVRRPLHFDWPEDQSTIAWLRVSFEENDGEGMGCTEVAHVYAEVLHDQRADLELLLEKTSRAEEHTSELQ